MMDEEHNLLCIFPNEYRFNLALKNYERLSFAETSQG
jgi:peptide chain release factor 3